MTVAFVLGGGGVLGAAEVGMLRALIERDIAPDLILGTSIGAINGALIAKSPTLNSVDQLAALWLRTTSVRDAYGDTALQAVRRAVTSRTHFYSADAMREALTVALGAATFADLAVPFEVCAVSIERAMEHWFCDGPVVEAVLASAAVPGILPPVEVGGEHYLDGGIVNSIPLGRAVRLGATTIFVLQVGRIERPLTVPTNPVEVAKVAFELARRHRFMREFSELPEGVTAHVLPTAGTTTRDDTILAPLEVKSIRERLNASYRASRRYLAEHL